MEPEESKTPSESLQTVPIYQLDASSSDSESDEPSRSSAPVGATLQPPSGVPTQSILSHRSPVVPPQRSYTTPIPRHERQTSEISMVAESVQTRPSMDDDYLFDEESTSEEEQSPRQARLTVPTGPPNVPVLIESPTPQYETRSSTDVPEMPTIVESRGLIPLSLLSEPIRPSRHDPSHENNEKSTHRQSLEQPQKGYEHTRGISKEGGPPPERRSREENIYHHHRESSDLLPLTLVDRGGGGLTFSNNYAYLSPPFGRVLTRKQIMARISWFSQLAIFNIVYAFYKLSEDKTTTNLIGLVILPAIFFILYIIFVTGLTYIDLKKKGYDSAFTIIYYSPLMLFSLFFDEKKRVDASKFHEVNYGAKWWRIGTSNFREGVIMTLYCSSIIAFVISDLVSRAVNQSNAQVSEVFNDFVPFFFMLVVFAFGFITSIWAVVEAIVAGTMHGSGEGRKKLVGVLPNAFIIRR
ncbi:11771_t:CDS:2 [Diversispora eburnea]|uniref:11771_t:CDS:1 n=1 Tax=Diversispora eburnea TaxID=1213867 RepID=A0A9N8WBQ2_9GLOM|nr:11771_t:CDS:2 [Diversispora eburnea]